MAKKNRRGKPAPSSEQAKQSDRHPIFGALKGTITIAPGVDLTEPADPEWGKVYDDIEQADQGVNSRHPKE